MMNLLTLPFEPLRAMFTLCCGKRPEKKNREEAIACIKKNEDEKCILNPMIVEKFEKITRYFEGRKHINLHLQNIQPCGDIKTDRLITVRGSIKHWNYAQIQLNKKLADEILHEGLKPLHLFLVGRELGKLHFDSHYSVVLERSRIRSQLCLLGYFSTTILVYTCMVNFPFLNEQSKKVKFIACHALSCLAARYFASFKSENNSIYKSEADMFAIVDQYREGGKLKIKVHDIILEAALEHLKASQQENLEPSTTARIEILEYLLKHHKSYTSPQS